MWIFNRSGWKEFVCARRRTYSAVWHSRCGFSVDLFFSLVNSKCHKGDVLKKTKEKRKKRKHEGSLELVMQNFLCFVSPTQGKCKYFWTVRIFTSCLRIPTSTTNDCFLRGPESELLGLLFCRKMLWLGVWHCFLTVKFCSHEKFQLEKCNTGRLHSFP